MQTQRIEELIARKKERLDILIEERSRLRAELSLHEFVKQAWKQVEGKRPFVDGWHIGAICEHLEAVSYGDIRYLLINIPPGCCKSTLVSVLWPVWTWIAKPEIRFICASYAASLSTRDALKARRVIQSPWFQQRWGHLFALTKTLEERYENDKRGYRISTSVEGTATGEGGDILITDDINNVKDSQSDAIKEKTLRFWRQVWPTRMRDDTRGAMVNIQQRIDELDVSGLILQGEDSSDWVKLILPMEFESARRTKTINLPSCRTGRAWQDPRKEDGDLLWPEFKTAAVVTKLKKQLHDEYAIAGQLQQRPAPEEGGILKKTWFRWWKKTVPPQIIQVIQSWDTALEDKRTSDYSACTTWGLFYEGNNQPNIILLNMWRGRVEYPDLHDMAIRFYKDYRDTGDAIIKPDGKHVPDMVLVESKVSGISLRQNLRRAGINAMGFDPTKFGDKMQRVRLITHYISGGRLWFPAKPPNFTTLRNFANITLDLCGIFPNGDSRDVVDTMAQLLLYLSQNGWLTHPDDETMIDTSMRPKDLPKWGEN